jgi:hypothetical protein
LSVIYLLMSLPCHTATMNTLKAQGESAADRPHTTGRWRSRLSR